MIHLDFQNVEINCETEDILIFDSTTSDDGMSLCDAGMPDSYEGPHTPGRGSGANDITIK